MFFSLLADLIVMIESYHPVPYWKQQFSRDVLSQIDQGWRLVGDPSCPCFVCYQTGTCHQNRTGDQCVWMCREEYEAILLGLALQTSFEPTMEENEARWAAEEFDLERWYD